MSGDCVTDLLSLLREMRRKKEKQPTRAQERRIGAVEAVAQREADRGRFKNLRSARNTVNDALAPRFGERSLPEFDTLADEWLRGRSTRLEAAAMRAVSLPSTREPARRWRGAEQRTVQDHPGSGHAGRLRRLSLAGTSTSRFVGTRCSASASLRSGPT
jgi:hypothetical protein